MAEKGQAVSLRKRKLHLDADDTVLGHRPRELNIVDYANCRLQEIVTLTKVVRNTSANKNALQDLPRHMRRRAASHNIKRLPRRVRQRAERAVLASAPTKTPCRKHRRRPSNLRADYARRQRTHAWLETHLWHAKRFHMTDRWGYKIPLHPNEKSIRAAYRASTQFCLMQDQSYLCCVEVCGSQTAILHALKQLTHPDTGLSFSSVSSLKGCREGRTFLYSPGQYPHGAIGPAQFLWRSGREEHEACLWVWLHPSIYETAVRELGAALGITALTGWGHDNKVTTTNTNDEDQSETRKEMKKLNVQNNGCTVESKSGKNTEQTCPQKSKDFGLDSSHDKKQKSFSNGTVSLTLLKNMLCRFRLTGPQSTTVLTSALTSVEEPVSSCSWWPDYGGGSEAWQTQEQMWRDMANVGSPAELSSHVILGLTVKDPRLTLPRKKMRKPGSDNHKQSRSPSPEWLRVWPSHAPQSALWEPSIRDTVQATKLSDHEMNKKRQDQLVPGQPLDLGPATSYVPILLIQQPGSCEQVQPASHPSCPAHHGAGWDVILPTGWGTAFWVALVYHGARAAGLRDDAAVAAEAGRLHFPEDYPDTSAGRQCEEDEAKTRQDKYQRMPPAKRPNYDKLSIVAPFRAPWTDLLREWSAQTDATPPPTSESTHSPMESEEPVCKKLKPEEFPVVLLRHKQRLQQLDRLCAGKLVAHASPVINGDVLVPVHLRMCQRGTPTQSALICLPTGDDLEELAKDPNAAGPVELLRIVCESSHSSATTASTSPHASNTAQVSLRRSCSRELLGFVQHGGYCLSQGQGAAKGLLAYGAVHTMVQLRPGEPAIVLLRAAHSLQYRYAYVSVNTEV